MAKVNANTKVEMTIKVTGTAEQLKGLAEYAKKNKLEVEQVKSAKVTEKAPAKTSAKKSGGTKKTSDFDRDKYESIAKELGVLGKNGVYKFARPVVYKAMEDADFEQNVDSYKAELNKSAENKNLTWFLGEEVEIEEDELADVVFN